jgi:Rod binding domain-containing protein
VRDQSLGSRELRDVADRVVGSVFYNTLLQQMRSSTLKGEYGHGGRGEEVFQAQLDQVLADRSGQATSTSLSDAIVRRYERQVALVSNQCDPPVGNRCHTETMAEVQGNEL